MKECVGTTRHGEKKSVMVLCFAADTSAPVSSGVAATGCSCGSAEAVAGTATSCDWLKTQKVVLPVGSSDAYIIIVSASTEIMRKLGYYVPLDPSRRCTSADLAEYPLEAYPCRRYQQVPLRRRREEGVFVVKMLKNLLGGLIMMMKINKRKYSL